MQTPDAEEIGRIARQRSFIQAMSKAIDGQPLAGYERALLNDLFEALLRGDDVAEMIGTKPPHARRSSDQVHVALHYLCLTRLKREPAAEAWRRVGEAWRLKRSEVQRIIAANRISAMVRLRNFPADTDPDRLLQLCERQARAASPAHRRVATDQPA
jgi:hypothetical protein